MNSEILSITPLGGVGQIGSNMTLINLKDRSIIIDSGILFPSEDFFDINYLIPDASDISGVTDLIITHGHEDHIGAVVHTIKQFPGIIIHASPFAAKLIRRKLAYDKISYPNVEIYCEDKVFNFGKIKIHPIHVNHSTPETYGLLIKDDDEVFSIFYSSDFKVDESNKYEKPFNFNKLKKLSRKSKMRLLLSDSTSISTTGKTGTESSIASTLSEIFKSNLDSRIFITCFASNIHRLQSIIASAEEHGKKVIPYGAAILNYISTSTELNLLKYNDKTIINPESVDDDKKNIVVILSGCQGDFRGSLRRVSLGEDRRFKPTHDDLFIFSSKTIPGNEKKISAVINALSEKQCRIITDRDELVHVSGHAGQEDLKEVYREFNPTHAVPIHGETYLLEKHQKFISENFPNIEPIRILNHHSLHIDGEGNITSEKSDEIRPIFIHGKGLEIERDAISKRRKMACNGTLFISIKLDSLKYNRPKFTFTTNGLPSCIDKHTDHFEKFIISFLKKEKIKKLEKTSEDLRIAIRRYFNEILGYKPITFIHFI